MYLPAAQTSLAETTATLWSRLRPVLPLGLSTTLQPGTHVGVSTGTFLLSVALPFCPVDTSLDSTGAPCPCALASDRVTATPVSATAAKTMNSRNHLPLPMY